MTIRVEVAWSPSPRQVERATVVLEEGASVADALAAIGPWSAQRLTASGPPDCGVWGRRVPLTHALRDGDRVEIYRPLVVDPKEARRLRYKGQRSPKTKRPAGAGR